MKLYMITIVALAVLLSACNQQKQSTDEGSAATAEQENEKPPVSLRLIWETEPTMTTCESVIYDEDNDVLYVSNINGAPDAKDGNGFISKVSIDGQVVEQSWVKGMDAPKGMGLHDAKLYVSDIDRVHEVDTKSGKITRTIPVAGAQFLNDVAVEGGRVYISDSRANAIYIIEDGKASAWVENLQGPNGLFIDGSTMLVALGGNQTINTLDPSSKHITQRTDGISSPDGIEAIGGDEYIVSSWQGAVYHIDSDWNKTLLLDSRRDSVNTADIGYVKSKNLLLVPTFFKNKVMAYEVVKE